ncbi:hypothetical protein DFH09DRAFT_1359660 [Mycena vulgaris]|nr:hypothetical protein DFH09DRAFT_1359660 [Mycena vulgaris]
MALQTLAEQRQRGTYGQPSEPYTRPGEDILLEEVRQQVRALEADYCPAPTFSPRYPYLPVAATLNSTPGVLSSPPLHQWNHWMRQHRARICRTSARVLQADSSDLDYPQSRRAAYTRRRTTTPRPTSTDVDVTPNRRLTGRMVSSVRTCTRTPTRTVHSPKQPPPPPRPTHATPRRLAAAVLLLLLLLAHTCHRLAHSPRGPLTLNAPRRDMRIAIRRERVAGVGGGVRAEAGAGEGRNASGAEADNVGVASAAEEERGGLGSSGGCVCLSFLPSSPPLILSFSLHPSSLLPIFLSILPLLHPFPKFRVAPFVVALLPPPLLLLLPSSPPPLPLSSPPPLLPSSPPPSLPPPSPSLFLPSFWSPRANPAPLRVRGQRRGVRARAVSGGVARCLGDSWLCMMGHGLALAMQRRVFLRAVGAT